MHFAPSASILLLNLHLSSGGQPCHDPEVYLLNYVPPELRIEVHKAFADGYANIMDSIAYVLKQGQLPKPRMVAQCASILPGVDKEATKFFLNHGGVAEYALDAVLSQCESPGSSTNDDDDDVGDGTASSSSGPVCVNDANWELLRQHLFSNSEFWPCGPYPMDDEGGEDGDGGDGWTYYDTSNWKPPSGATTTNTTTTNT